MAWGAGRHRGGDTALAQTRVDAAIPIVFVSSGAKLGGEERYLRLLMEGLDRSWIRGVVCLENGPLVGRLREEGYPVQIVPTSRRASGIARSALTLRRLLRRERPSLVHANGVKAAVVSTLSTVGVTTPVLWVKHDFSWDGRLARIVGSRCRQVVGVSEAVTRTFDGTAVRVRVVHNGLEPPPLDREASKRALLDALGPPEPRAVVALVGRIDPAKGHREVIAALPELVRAVPGLRVAVLGAEHQPHLEYAAELRRDVAGAGLAAAVSFLGYREDAIELMGGCDVIVIPSGPDARGMDTEGFPYVGLEAMAVGTPVVGYSYGGLPELVGPCGSLVPRGDRVALGEAILQLLSDRELRERLSRCGRTRVAAEFSLERMLDAMKERYRAVVNSTRDLMGTE